MKLQTLRYRDEFLKVSKSSLKIVMPYFILQIQRNSFSRELFVSDGAVRFGFVVSRKIGNSVERNFVKRRLRSLCVLHRDLCVGGYDYVFVARYQKEKVAFDRLELQFLESLKRMGSLVSGSYFFQEERALK